MVPHFFHKINKIHKMSEITRLAMSKIIRSDTSCTISAQEYFDARKRLYELEQERLKAMEIYHRETPPLQKKDDDSISIGSKDSERSEDEESTQSARDFILDDVIEEKVDIYISAPIKYEEALQQRLVQWSRQQAEKTGLSYQKFTDEYDVSAHVEFHPVATKKSKK